MKNIKAIFLLFVLISISTSLSLAQDRNTLWLQGTGKTKTDIRGYADKFQAERHMNSYRQDYDTKSQQGVATTSNTIGATAQTQFTATPSSIAPIAVGHDMGGLMARKIEANFGGLILKGTPNRGMPLLESYAGGKLDEFATLGNQKINGAVTTNFCMPGVSSSTPISPANIPLEWAKGTFGNLPLSESVTDMMPGSSFLTGLTEPTKPTVVIWGNENDPSLWRMFSSGSCKTIGALPIGSAAAKDSDLPLMTDIRDKTNDLKSQKNKNLTIGILECVGAVGTIVVTIATLPAINTGIPEATASFTIKLGQDARKRFKIVDSLKVPIKWLNDAPNMWNDLIGATNGTYTATYTWDQIAPGCLALVNGTMDWGIYYGTLTNQQQQDCYESVSKTVEIPINGPSDGLLSKFTQTNVNSVKEYEGIGANHEEELNHASVTAAYIDAWNGGANSIFTTSPR